MAILKVVDGSYENIDAVDNLICYIAERSEVAGGWGISMASVTAIISEFKAVKRFWNKTGGRQIKHFIISWKAESSLNILQMQYMAAYLTAYFHPEYQVFWGVHLDTDTPHIHIAVNTVSCSTGKKLIFEKEDLTNYHIFIDNIVNKVRRELHIKNYI